ncbi:hypothetical protein NQ318_010816 [Aromia moschata]|uniref:Zinc carboxypeptidase A 1 n=1 Tax=Aromia moschata TaxID=1265417 RepID=A0AAV8YGP5_9CUCU|nr:hypothetical protein NQ318_010816 [Aromia moschata]
MRLLVVLVLTSVGLTVAQEIFSYDGYKVYKVTAKSSDEIDLLTTFDDEEKYDFWSKHRVINRPMDVMVSPNAQAEFEAVLSAHKINYEIIIENVEEKVQQERIRKYSTRVESGQVTFEEYMRHDEINAYLLRLAEEYSEIVTTELIGKSFEGRDLILIKISSGGANKPIIFADAGIHAREWIAPSVALYIIQQLVENPSNTALYQNVDWAIIPVANPDGYEYSHTKERMWRKTRSPGTICYGCDPNRNFGYRWGESGSSTWQCTEIFAGRHAFSEVETVALRDYMLPRADDIKLYVAIHSYGNWVLYPWSYAMLLPDNANQLQEVGEIFNDAVYAVGGGNYTVGNSAQLLGATAGCSDDYVLGGLGVNISYTLELPGGGSAGFDLPATQIQTVVEQVWVGWQAWHQYVEENYVNASSLALNEGHTSYERKKNILPFIFSYKVYQVTPSSMDEANALKQLESNENFDFWSDLRAINISINIMVSPSAQDEFEDLLESYSIDSTVLIDDVEEVFEEESRKQRISTRSASGEVSFTEFMRYDDIVAYLERLEQEYPDIVTTEVVGKSFEGRDVVLIRISSGGSNKTTIFAEAAIHAREWIAPPVALYVINQLVENSNNSYMYEDIDWAIMPVANPDGYEFCHEDTRLWRKTRSPGTICYGTDPNRNFDFNWKVIGASSWQCDQTYAGHVAFSDPETQNIRDYGQWMLYPWGHTTDEPENSEELNELGNLFADAIYAVNGTVYTVGSTANLLYYAAGVANDWAAGVAGIDLSYTIELPGGGANGHDIPAERIVPVVEETWEGFKALHSYIRNKFVNSTYVNE